MEPGFTDVKPGFSVSGGKKLTERGFKIRALGEIAIRCDSLTAMMDFYERIIGLDRMSGNASEGIVFYRISEGFEGHTNVLALFERGAGRSDIHPTDDVSPATGAGSSLHHLALSLPFSEQQAVMDWFDVCDQSYNVQNFDWVGWRGIFTTDPEGNIVELVAYDPASGRNEGAT